MEGLYSRQRKYRERVSLKRIAKMMIFWPAGILPYFMLNLMKTQAQNHRYKKPEIDRSIDRSR